MLKAEAELLRVARLRVVDVDEALRREGRDLVEGDRAVFRERVADAELAVSDEADHVARPCLVDRGAGARGAVVVRKPPPTVAPASGSVSQALARQLVARESPGKIVNVASYQVRPNEVIKIRDSKREKGLWKAFAEKAPVVEVPSWISADPKTLTAKITSKPEGDELKQIFDPKLIIEFYSR